MSEKIEFTTSVEIDANSEKVWNTFADTSKYPQWNPFIKRLYGELGLGKAIIEIAYFYDYVYLPIQMKIIEFENGKKITWIGNLPGFSDHHIYKFEEIENGRTLFSHAASFSGIFALGSRNHINTDVRRVHNEMNLALKKRVEKK